MIALLCAIREEIKDIERKVGIERVVPYGGGWYATGKFENQDILLVQTGIGKVKAEGITEYILHNFSIGFVVSLGFGGALVPELRVGDLILCREIQFEGNPIPRQIQYSNGRLIQLAAMALEGSGVAFHTGECLTVDRPVTNPSAKKVLGKETLCQVLDMESYWIARSASNHGVDFLVVRAISDALYDLLPPFDHFMDSNGAWRRKDFLRYFVSKPKDLKLLPRIYSNARKARSRLTYFAQAFVSEVGSKR